MPKQRSIELTQEDIQKRGLMRNGVNFPYNPNNLKKAEKLRKNMTRAECKLWFEYLQKHPCKFYRQRPIDHFIVDFYCSQSDLVIEIDGETHASLSAQEYDAMRTALLNLYGLQVLRFTNQQVFYEFDEVCHEIEKLLE